MFGVNYCYFLLQKKIKQMKYHFYIYSDQIGLKKSANQNFKSADNSPNLDHIILVCYIFMHHLRNDEDIWVYSIIHADNFRGFLFTYMFSVWNIEYGKCLK